MSFVEYWYLTRNAFLFSIHSLYTHFRTFALLFWRGVSKILLVWLAISLILVIILVAFYADPQSVLANAQQFVQDICKGIVPNIPLSSDIAKVIIFSLGMYLLGIIGYIALAFSYVMIGLYLLDHKEIYQWATYPSWAYAFRLAPLLFLVDIVIDGVKFIGLWVGVPAYLVKIILAAILVPFLFVIQYMVDEKLLLWGSLKKSIHLTFKYLAYILLLFFIERLVYFFLPCEASFSRILLVFITAPLSCLFYTYIYRDLKKRTISGAQ